LGEVWESKIGILWLISMEWIRGSCDFGMIFYFGLTLCWRGSWNCMYCCILVRWYWPDNICQNEQLKRKLIMFLWIQCSWYLQARSSSLGRHYIVWQSKQMKKSQCWVQVCPCVGWFGWKCIPHIDASSRSP
jgi:hypothetical protein